MTRRGWMIGLGAMLGRELLGHIRPGRQRQGLVLAGLTLLARAAAADIAPLETHADDVTLDARLRELELRGNVRLDSPPFHLRSDALRLRRTPHGIEVEGAGRLAFCQCLGTPVAVGFDGAVVAPPGDLLLRHPTLEILGVPVLWAPYFWLRSPTRFGVLAPDLAWRGTDGFFAGGGIHVPWGAQDPISALDVRAGAYVRGGSAYEVALRTPSSQTRVRYEHREGDGLLADVRGAIDDMPGHPRTGGETLAWDADLLRGPRAVLGTTELEAAARIYDRARGEAQVRDGAFTFAAGIRSTSVRGGDLGSLGAWGPLLTARRGEAIGDFGTYEVALTGGGLESPIGPAGAPDEMLPYGRAELGTLLAGHLGAVGTSLSLRGAGNVVGGDHPGSDGAASARAELSIPLVRAFASSDPADPWRHRIEPRLSAGGLVLRASDALASDFGVGRGFGGISGAAWVAETGLASAIGRWGRGDGFELSASAGIVGDDLRAIPVARWRASATHDFFGLGAEGAHLARALRFTAAGADEDSGHAVVARSRIGRVDGLHLSANVAVRRGVDPVTARLLTDAPLEPSAGFLAATGTTGGAFATLPLSHAIITRGGTDADLTEPRLLAARGSVELRDRCGCIALRVTGSHRLGREGVDIWMTIDLAPNTPR